MDPANMIENGVEILTELECRSLLDTGFIGRVGIDLGGVPAILPVRYAVAGSDVVFRTGAGLKLEAAASGRTVAFEVDHYDREIGTGWSVLIAGPAHEISEDEVFPAEAARLQAAAPGDRHHIVRISPEVISGRRFGWDAG